ncbi:MAG: hypothetical protein RL172_1516 [Bacteroidota bacterium]
MKQLFTCAVVVVFGLLSSHCNKTTATTAIRTFYMGTTPWPADFTQQEVNNAYDFINQHCDMVSHHFDEGIPYEEAYQNANWPAALQQGINTRKTKTGAGKKILLSSSALALNRISKAPYSSFSTAINNNIKQQWQALPINDDKVITAYINYLLYLVAQLNPSYINYAVESNHHEWDSAAFAQYKFFLEKVYVKLKAAYPTIPIMLSWMVSEQPAALDNARQLLPYTDYTALSAYPYVAVSSAAAGNTNPALFPADIFTRFIKLDAGKPLCVTETGYIAQPLQVPAYELNRQGTAQWQDAYLQMVCQLLQQQHGKFLIWFCHKDYDAGNRRLETLGIYQPLFAFWQDTGLLDEEGKQRPAWQTWQSWLAKTLKP